MITLTMLDRVESIRVTCHRVEVFFVIIVRGAVVERMGGFGLQDGRFAWSAPVVLDE